MQAALNGCEVGLPGGEAVVQLLPLLLAKGAVCAVADGADNTGILVTTKKTKAKVL